MGISANSEEGRSLLAQAFGRDGKRKGAGKRKRQKGEQSPAEELLALQLRLEGIEGWKREYRFSPPRRWRFDFAFPDHRFAVEIEGITGGEGGRHQRFDGFQKDLDKYAAAMLDGWTTFRVSPRMVKSGEAVEVISTMLERLCPSK